MTVDQFLQIIDLYNSRLSALHQMIELAYDVGAFLDERLPKVFREREELHSRIRELLARNCSLRKKDFDDLMERVSSQNGQNESSLQEMRRSIDRNIRMFVDGQKKKLDEFRSQLEKESKAAIQGWDCRLSVSMFDDEGAELISQLDALEAKLRRLYAEQKSINHELSSLQEKGAHLRIGDIKELGAWQSESDHSKNAVLCRITTDGSCLRRGVNG